MDHFDLYFQKFKINFTNEKLFNLNLSIYSNNFNAKILVELNRIEMRRKVLIFKTIKTQTNISKV